MDLTKTPGKGYSLSEGEDLAYPPPAAWSRASVTTIEAFIQRFESSADGERACSSPPLSAPGEDIPCLLCHPGLRATVIIERIGMEPGGT